MGFFDKIFKRDCAWHLARSRKYAQDGDFGEAMISLKQGEAMASGEGEKEAAKAWRKELTHDIYEHAYEQAKRFIKTKNHEAAQNALDRAARHIQSDEERDALNALIDEEHQEAAVVQAHVDGEDQVSSLDDEDKWNLYVTKLSFEKAQQFDELGQDFKRAWMALQEGRFEDAIDGLERVCKAHPDDATVMMELGRAYYGKGDFVRADELLSSADKARADIEIKLLWAEILWAQKRFDVAETVLQSAHDLDPENITVLARIAQHGLLARDFESGIAAIEVLLESLPNDVSIQRLGGRLYQESGDDDKALECYENVNRLYWQVNPQTKKLTFDQNSAAAAAAIYVKKNENLQRAVTLLDAIRANSTGEGHVGVCLQLADVYEKMNKKSRRDELLTESLRFMDDMIESSKGAERALIQLQYAEVAEKVGDDAKSREMLEASRLVFEPDAAKGHPVAAFYLDLIERKKAGEPFPTPSQMQARMLEFVKGIQEGRAPVSAENVRSVSYAAPGVSVQVSGMSDNEEAMHRMAALAGEMKMQAVTVGGEPESEGSPENGQTPENETAEEA